MKWITAHEAAGKTFKNAENWFVLCGSEVIKYGTDGPRVAAPGECLNREFLFFSQFSSLRQMSILPDKRYPPFSKISPLQIYSSPLLSFSCVRCLLADATELPDPAGNARACVGSAHSDKQPPPAAHLVTMWPHVQTGRMGPGTQM